MTIEAMAVEFVAATKKRANARSNLTALRRKYLEETGQFFDKDEGQGDEGYDEMMAALKAREDANADYRRAKGRLFRACTAGVRVLDPLLSPKLFTNEEVDAFYDGWEFNEEDPGRLEFTSLFREIEHMVRQRAAGVQGDGRG